MCASNSHGELFLIPGVTPLRILSPLTPPSQQIVGPPLAGSPADLSLDKVRMVFTGADQGDGRGGPRCLAIPLSCLGDGSFDVGGCLNAEATLLLEWAIQGQK